MAALAAALAGCSGLAAPTGELVASAPDPAAHDLIAAHLKRILKNYSTYDSFEISEPRWVRSFKGWNWLTCVRFRDHGHTRTYALFMDGKTIVEDRYAVQTDQCDAQSYGPFGNLPSGLDPLH